MKLLQIHRNTKDEVLILRPGSPLVEVYSYPWSVCHMKSTQNGISEWALITAFGFAEIGLSHLYVLPTEQLRNRFIDQRVDGLSQRVPYYGKVLGSDSNNKSLKSYKRAFLAFIGSNSQVGFTEFPGDIATIDEYDQCEQSNLPMVDERLAASAFRIIRKISQPTVNGFGIAAEYETSDKRRWFVKCQHCNKYNHPTFLKHLADEKGEPYDRSGAENPLCICEHCHKPFDRFGRGQWVAENSRPYRGYHFSKLFSTQVTTGELIVRYQKGLFNASVMQRVYNGDWGLPYNAPGSSVDEDMLNACIDPEYSLPGSCSEPCVAGIDTGGSQGDRHNVIVLREGRLMYVGIVRNEREIIDLYQRFNVRVSVIDAGPERRMVRRVQVAHKGTFRCNYLNGKSEETEISRPKVQHGRKVTVNRTDSMDTVHEYIGRQKLVLPFNAKLLDDGQFYDQMQTPTRVYDEDRQMYIWTEVGADHYYHAMNYALIADTLWTQIKGIKARSG